MVNAGNPDVAVQAAAGGDSGVVLRMTRVSVETRTIRPGALLLPHESVVEAIEGVRSMEALLSHCAELRCTRYAPEHIEAIDAAIERSWRRLYMDAMTQVSLARTSLMLQREAAEREKAAQAEQPAVGKTITAEESPEHRPTDLGERGDPSYVEPGDEPEVPAVAEVDQGAAAEPGEPAS